MFLTHCHLKDTQEKPYGCHCGQSFTRRDLLTRHQRLYHNEGHQIRGASAGAGSASTVHSYNPTSTSAPQVNGRIDNPEHHQEANLTSVREDSSHCFEAMQDFTEFMNVVGLDFELDIETPPPCTHHETAGAEHGQSSPSAFSTPLASKSSQITPTHTERSSEFEVHPRTISSPKEVANQPGFRTEQGRLVFVPQLTSSKYIGGLCRTYAEYFLQMISSS
jgi:uncharacterized Zn-finger protein